MKNIIYTFIALLICFTLADAKADSKASAGVPKMSLYFLEFKTKTYAAVTMENIEDSSDYRFFFYKRNPFMDEIRTILETRRTKEAIDNHLIRLKIILSDKDKQTVYYVDSNGVVLKNDKTFLLDDKELKRLEKQVLYFNGVVDVWPEFDAMEN